jgi:hypothetical protein
MMNTFTFMSSIAWHIFNKHHCFLHLYKYLVTIPCIHQILCVRIKSCEYAMYSRCSR